MTREQRIRLRLAKLDEVRHISHLDLARTLQRALRRAGLPVSHSEGFNPHPRVSFASALALGATSGAEVVDVDLEERMPPGDFSRRLARELPAGIRVLETCEVPVGDKSPAARLTRAAYEVDLAVPGGNPDREWEQVIRDFLDQERIEILRKRKKKAGARKVDIRPLIGELRVTRVTPGLLTLEMLLGTGSRGNVRPDEVARALSQFTRGGIEPEPRKVHRLELFFD